MARVLVIRPDELSPAGLIAESLERAEIHAVTVKLDEGDAPPDDLDAYDGALLLGGPQSVVEEKDAVLIADCTEVARHYHQAGKPLLGICLGAQVIAYALGARVWRLDRLQFGLQDLARAPAADGDPLVGRMQPIQPAFLWHEDGFALPAGARHLVSRKGHSNYGYAVGPTTYGFQCHLEVTEEGIRRMIERGAHFVIKHLGAEGEALLGDLDTRMEAQLPSAMQFGSGVGAAWAALVNRAAGKAASGPDDQHNRPAKV